MMLLLIKTASVMLVLVVCGFGLARWWFNRRGRIITHDYARADGELLSWRQALSARIQDPLVVLVPVHQDLTSRPCPLEGTQSPERANSDSRSTTQR